MNAKTAYKQSPDFGVPVGYYRDQRGRLREQSASTPVQRRALALRKEREAAQRGLR